MSRAFVKDDGPEEQPLVPPRAPLPPGVANYVTPRGLALLKAEFADLEAERGRLQSDAAAGAHAQALVVLAGRIAELAERIGSAKVVKPRGAAPDAVRFGLKVTLRTLSGGPTGEERTLTIVGVDEADAAENRVAFTAPIARAVMGKRIGEKASLQTARGDEVLEVRAIANASD